MRRLAWPRLHGRRAVITIAASVAPRRHGGRGGRRRRRPARAAGAANAARAVPAGTARTPPRPRPTLPRLPRQRPRRPPHRGPHPPPPHPCSRLSRRRDHRRRSHWPCAWCRRRPARGQPRPAVRAGRAHGGRPAVTAPACQGTTPLGLPGTWNCTFDDEFNGTTLNTNNWVPQETARQRLRQRRHGLLRRQPRHHLGLGRLPESHGARWRPSPARTAATASRRRTRRAWCRPTASSTRPTARSR